MMEQLGTHIRLMTMVKINFDQVLKDLDGNSIKEPPKTPEDPTPKEEREDLTLKSVCVTALLANIPNEKITGKEKLQRFENARVIHKGGEINFESETIALLKRLISQVYGTLVSAQV